MKGQEQTHKGQKWKKWLPRDTCEWKSGNNSLMLDYTTSCNHTAMIDGGPESYGYVYCPYCGGKIQEV